MVRHIKNQEVDWQVYDSVYMAVHNCFGKGSNLARCDSHAVNLIQRQVLRSRPGRDPDNIRGAGFWTESRT